MELRLYNTLSKSQEVFSPLSGNRVGFYACGPTVYNFPHIGNLRMYIFEDILKRVLLFSGYSVNHVMNITDVGHLTSDEDEGEDKMEAGARREGKTVYEIAEYYTKVFKENLDDLHILHPDTYCNATDHISDMIELIQKLEKKGFTYQIADGVYYDTARFPEYGKMAQLAINELKAGARVAYNEEKKNPTDFALWKFSPQNSQRAMEWDSPWGKGFPGWHLECSAMSMKSLGEQFDIHCGGTDHIKVHHTNEIAQAQGVTGLEPVKYWLHGEFLNLNKEKMSKSGEKFIILQTLTDKGFEPLSFRYLCLTAHYRSHLTFTWESLEAAQAALRRIRALYYRMLTKENKGYGDFVWQELDMLLSKVSEDISAAFRNDLDTPFALGLLFSFIDMVERKIEKNKLGSNDLQKIKELLEKCDKVLGLGISETENVTYAEREKDTSFVEEVKMRIEFRNEKKWEEADRIREVLLAKNFEIKDTISGTEVLHVPTGVCWFVVDTVNSLSKNDTSIEFPLGCKKIN